MARDGHQGQGGTQNNAQGNSQENVLNNAVEHQATPDRGTDEHRAAERDNQQNTLAATTATGAESSQQNTYANQPNDPSPEPDEEQNQGRQQPVEEEAGGSQGAASGARRVDPDTTPSGDVDAPEDDAGSRAAPQSVGGESDTENAGRPAEHSQANAQVEDSSGNAPAEGASSGAAGVPAGSPNTLDTETTSEAFEVNVANASTREMALEDIFDTETMHETFEIQVENVNDEVVIDGDAPAIAISGTEDQSLIITEAELLANASDVDGDVLTVTNIEIDNATIETVLDPDTGETTFVVTPDADVNGSLEIRYDVSDQQGSEVATTATLDLAAVNDAAVVAQDTEVVGTEDTEIIFTQDMLLQHVSDIDSDNVTAENLQIAPEYGSVVDNEDGTFTFTPAQDYNGDVPFTFDVNDNDGAITPASGNVDVAAVNDAAVVAQDTELVGTEDTEIIFTQDMLLQHVSDIDSDNVTAENLQIAPEYGMVVDNEDGTFTFTPAQDYNGDVPFTFDVNDNDGAITPASGNVDLAAVNDAAVVAQDTEVVGTEDTEIIFTQDMLLQHVSDIDSDNLTAENLQIVPEYGSLVDNEDGTFTFTPAQDYHGDVPFTFDVNDNDGAITPASGNVDLAAANDAPVLAETSFTLNEDGSIVIDPAALLENATDIDGDELSISNITSDEHGSVTQNDQGEWVYTPNADYSGDAELTITVFDGTVHTDFPAPVTVTPDADAPSLTVSLTDGAVNVQPMIQVFNVNPSVQPVSPANTFDEDTPVPLNISAAVTDIDGSESMQSLVLDDIPEGSTLTDGTHTFTADGDTHSVDITEWDVSQITFQGAENFHGSVSLSLTAKSQEDSTMSGDAPETASTTTAIEFEIVPVNDEVVIDGEERLDFATQEDTAIVITEAELLANASDVDGDTLMVTNLTMDSGSARLVVDPDSGERSFVITPNQDVNGDFTLHFDVSDGNGSVVASNAQLTVSPENDAAVVSQDTEVTGTEDTDVIFTQDMLLQYATDIDSDNLTAENLQIAPEYGSVVDNQDGTFTFTPAADYNGDVPFTFDVNDNDGAITPASGNVDLAAVNDAAVVAQDTDVVGTEDTDVIFTQDMLLQHVSDIDSDNLTAENLQIAPEYGSVVDNQDGTFTFTPAQDYNGDVPFTFDVNDNDGGITPASGNVDLAAVNDAAVVAQDADIAGREDTDLIITQDMLLQHATDIDSDNLTAENLQIAPEYGTVKDNGDGTFTFSPTENYHGEVPFTFDVNDNDGAITPASGQIDVASVNDRVIAQDDNQMSASDPMIRLESAPQHGSVEYMNADGEWTEMVVGEEYPADTQVQFVPDAEDVQSGTRDIQVGSFDSDTSTHVFDGRASVDDWGDVDGNTAVYTEDGVTITTEVNTGELAAWNGAGSHVGAGIGNQSRHGLDTNEMLTVTVEGEDVNQITFQLDGLGGYFDETSRNATEVLISAYDADGNLIDAQGGYRESGDYQDTYVFTTDVPVHHFTLGTTGSNGTYVVQNMTVSRTMSDEIQMTTIQPDGSEVLNTVNLDLNHNTAHDPVDVTESLIEVDEGITTQAIKVEEDGQLVLNPSELLKNDTDADGDTLTIIGVEATDDTHGEVSLDEDGNVVFTPDADYNGPASFTYIVSDGNGSTDTASVTVDVTPVNDDPIAPTVTMNGDEDQVIVIDPAFILQQASDTDGDQLTLESLSLKNPQNGQLQLQQDGTYHLLTPPDFNGLVELDYQISDGTEMVDGNMKVDVLPVNDAPFHGGNAQLTTYEDGAFTFRADDMLDLFRDVDGDDLVVSRVITADGEEGGELTQNDDGSWTFTPSENYAGTAELQVEVTDPSGATAMLDVPLFIRPVADGAVITTDHDGPLVFDEDTTGLLGLNVDMVDASEQLSHFVITGFPVGFEVSDGINSVVITEPGQVVDITEWSFNDLSMTPPQDFVGNFFVTVSATTADYGEESSSQVSEPTEAYADFTTTQDEALLLTAEDLLDMAGDQEGADADDIQGVHLIDRSQGELTDNGDGTWSFVPADDFTGQVDFAYQIQQGDALVDVQSSIAVGEASDGAAPEANAAPTVDQIVTTELGAGNSLTFTPDDLLGQISDGDNDELSIESVQVINGQGVLETHDNGTYSFTPAEGFSGMAQIAFVATDGEASVRSHFNVDVAEAAPSGDFMLDEMGALVLSAEDIRESLNLADTVDITHVDYHGEAGTLIEDDGQWVFWSDDDFEGQLDLEVTAQDGDTSSVHDLSLTVDEYQDTAPQSQPFQADRMEDDSAQETVDTQTVEEDGSAEEAGSNDDSADLTAAPGSDVRFTLPEEVTDNPDVQQVEITNLPEGATLNTGIPDGEGGYTLSGDLSQPVTMTLPEGNEGTTTMQFEGQTDVGDPVAGAEGSLTIEVDDAHAMQSGGQGGDSPQGMQDESEQGDWTQGDNTNMGVDVMDDSASYDNDGAGSQQEDAGMMDDSMTP